MTLTVWADVRCPWCWIGHRSLTTALGSVSPRVPVVHMSYLLEPTGPERPGGTVREAALTCWGMDEGAWRAMRNRVENAGRAAGLHIRMDGVPNIDSRPVHRLLKYAIARGADPHTCWDLAFSALLEHNRDLADPAVLRELGTAFGLITVDVDVFSGSSESAAEVEADHRSAIEAGVRSVPTFVRGDRVLSGARGVREIVDLLRASPTGAEGVGQ